MKRLAVLVLLAIPVAGSRLVAADPVVLPLPTGMARTSPSVAAPVLVNGLPEGTDFARSSFRDRMTSTTVSVPSVEAETGSGPRAWSRLVSWRPCGKSCDAVTLHGKPAWCEECSPIVRRPLPPLPAGLSAGHSAPCAAPRGPDGSCCQKLKEWLCFHYSPVRTPLVPTPKYPALYTYFPTQERAGLCGGDNCAGGKCRLGGAAGCVNCPVPGEGILSGYRLANPER